MPSKPRYAASALSADRPVVWEAVIALYVPTLPSHTTFEQVRKFSWCRWLTTIRPRTNRLMVHATSQDASGSYHKKDTFRVRRDASA